MHHRLLSRAHRNACARLPPAWTPSRFRFVDVTAPVAAQAQANGVRPIVQSRAVCARALVPSSSRAYAPCACVGSVHALACIRARSHGCARLRACAHRCEPCVRVRAFLYGAASKAKLAAQIVAQFLPRMGAQAEDIGSSMMHATIDSMQYSIGKLQARPWATAVQQSAP